MRDTWELLESDAEEARRFANLDVTLDQTTDLAAPPNTYRRVYRIESADGGPTYYLKEFRRTQWKNRWRSRLTRPRCVHDGARERAVAEALTKRGFTVARPVAAGQRGPASFYLCAALPGRSLRDIISAGAMSPSVAGAAARFAGAILRAGIRLPDLSADHIFLLDRQDAGPPRFAVIDLHNGGLGVTKTTRAAARILRRFRRSVRGLAISRSRALAFACRFLRTARYPRRLRRRVMRRVPPIDTHGRYEVPGRAHAYRTRSAARTKRELHLLERVWPGAPGDLVLDSPSGAGRLAGTLERDLGARRVGADRAMAMLCADRAADLGGSRAADSLLVQAEATVLPFRDAVFDVVVVFRFLHHLDPTTCRHALHEAARVAGRFLVISFFHPVSAHGLSRRLRELCTHRARTRFAMTHGRLSAMLREVGFTPEKLAADRPYLKDFWVAAFRRNPG